MKFKSVCGQAGVSEDGKLYVWGGVAAYAAFYRSGITQEAATRRDYSERPLRYQMSDYASLYDRQRNDRSANNSSLFQIGGDEDWKFVASPPAGHSEEAKEASIIAVKEDGSVWTLSEWQSGVDCQWGAFGLPPFGWQPWRAKLNSSISGFRSDFTRENSWSSVGGLPVWFTAAPQSAPEIQKIRSQWGEIAVASGEPGSGATVRSEFRAKIDDGCILGVTIVSGGSGYSGSERTVTLRGHENTGSGAIAIAKIGSSQSIESILIIDPGEGYRHPVTATVAGNAVLSVPMPKRVRVTDEGSGYTSVPSVSVTPAADDQSADAQAEGAFIEVSEMSRCGVGAFKVISAGSGYTFANAVETRTGATATAVVNQQGEIVDWTLDSPGEDAYSPLDDEPLSVKVTGDGDGAVASALPSGSRVTEVKLVSNPEVWTLPPNVSFVGGGGRDAKAVVEGIVGRVSVSVENPGAGYTKTAVESGTIYRFPFQSTPTGVRAGYSPCAVTSAANAVGGARFGGSVIVAEATLSPSEILKVDEDAAEYSEPRFSPYELPSDNRSPVAPEETLKRHRMAMTRLTAASGGVVNPFEEELTAQQPGTLIDGELQVEDYVSQCIRAYLRGPGHERHQLQVTFVKFSLEQGNFRIKVSLSSPIPMSQPPALVVEYHARPHKFPARARDGLLTGGGSSDEASGPSGGGSGNGCYEVFIDYGPANPNAQPWWAWKVFPATTSPDDPSEQFYTGGPVTATGVSGAIRTYQVVDGRLVPESGTPASAPGPLPPNSQGSLAGVQEYRGPLFEVVHADPHPSWSKPSDAQRVHFVYRTEEDFSARGEAEVVYDQSLGHPVVGPVVIKENGRYSREPEPLVIISGDPVPRDTGLKACESAGFGLDGAAYAYAGGKLYWWGSSAAIAQNEALSIPAAVTFLDEPDGEDDPAEAYKQRLRTIGVERSGVTPRPTLVGGHLRFEVSGSLVTNIPTPLSGGPAAYMRMPRPSYGNHVVRRSLVFSPSQNRSLGGGGFYSLIPGEQQDNTLLRYRPFSLSEMDHGLGYEGGVSLEYRGPGISPHTMTLTPSVVPHGITHVGKNGLLRDTAGKWRVPAGGSYKSATAFPWGPLSDSKSRTVTVNSLQLPPPCGLPSLLRTYTVTDGPNVDFQRYVAAVRAAGSGYLGPVSIQFNGSDSWKQAGGGIAALSVTTKAYTLNLSVTQEGDNVSRYEFTRSLLGEFDNVQGQFTSSRGGFRLPAFRRVTGSDPPVASVTGGGQGAIVEVFASPERRFTPFLLWCLDDLSETTEPGPTSRDAGLAVAADGTLRSVRDGLAFRPEAFEGFPPVTGIATLPAQDFLPMPYFEEGDATHIARDTGGKLWAIRMGEGGSERSGPFLLPLEQSEPALPILVAPLAVASTDAGEGYDYPATVLASRPSGVAAGTVQIDGRVVGIAVIEGGSGYESPPQVTGVASEAIIAGPVWRIDLTSGGSGYRIPPRVRFSSPGVSATAAATISDGKVTAVRVLFGGMYNQQPPLVEFEPVADVGRVSVVSGGADYSESPSVIIAGGGGQGATATANISCSVSEIALISQGSGYKSPPLVEITGGGGSGASATAVVDLGSGRITGVSITNGGSGYTSRPLVRFVGGSGSGASGQARIKGFLASIDLISRGEGYDSPPRVVVTGGGGKGAEAVAIIEAVGSGAAATARINGSVVAVRVTNPGSNLQKPPAVSCNHSSQPVAGLSRSNAMIKAAILGRPTGVTVTDPGKNYCSPFYSPQESPGPSKLSTPSIPVRRPVVAAKGSFYFNADSLRFRDSFRESDAGPEPSTKSTIVRASGFGGERSSWANTFWLLGLSQVSGDTANGEGSIDSVILPKIVTRLRVTSPGGNYKPHQLIPVKFKGGGQRDVRFRLFWDNERTRRRWWRQPAGGSSPTGVTAIEELWPRIDDVVAYAYAGADGKIAGIVPMSFKSQVGYGGIYGWPGGITPYVAPPQFEVDAGFDTGSGATLVADLEHPLECYYAPQALFDGGYEVEADMSLTLAGLAIEGNGSLPAVCIGGPENLYWERTLDQGRLNRSKLFQRHALIPDAFLVPPDVRLDVVGTLVGFSPRLRKDDWADEDKEFFDAPLGYFATPPSVVLEDELGSGASVATAALPANGAVSLKWVEDCALSAGGVGYTLRTRIRLTGGVPLARNNPAVATAQVGQSGRVLSVTLAGGGKGYTQPPLVFIVGDGTGAAASVSGKDINASDGSITRIRLLSGGSGYTAATVVVVDRETAAEKSKAIAKACEFIDERYSAALENSTLHRAFIPPERRRHRTTVAVKNALNTAQLGPQDSMPADFDSEIIRQLHAAGYRLHGAFLSDGSVEYIRLEHHFGERPPEQTTFLVTANGVAAPERPATAIAKAPACDNVFSSTVANVVSGGPKDFPWTQFSRATDG